MIRMIQLVGLLVLSCGGGQSKPVTQPGEPGTPGSPTAQGTAIGPDATVDANGQMVETPTSPVTFRLKNTAQQDLAFSIEKGWQHVVFAYSGVPPKAKPIVLFPTFCTAACDASAEEICPYCPEPESVKEIKAAEQRQIVKPGAFFDVPWDGCTTLTRKRGASETAEMFDVSVSKRSHHRLKRIRSKRVGCA